jgi:hypothetical protein
VFRSLKIVNKDVNILYSGYKQSIFAGIQELLQSDAVEFFQKPFTFRDIGIATKICARTVSATIDKQDCPDRATSRPAQFDQDAFKTGSLSVLHCTVRESRRYFSSLPPRFSLINTTWFPMRRSPQEAHTIHTSSSLSGKRFSAFEII